jgi:hypothetical protein
MMDNVSRTGQTLAVLPPNPVARRDCGTEQVGVAVTVFALILEFLASNLDGEAVCPDQGFFLFFLVPAGKCRCSTSTRPLPNLFEFIIHQ